MDTIQILPSSHIHETLWNRCVQQNANGLIYATTSYLNHICNNWFGVVVNNYELIFPLPIKKKWGIQYAYTPPFTQQLGFIGNLQLVNAQLIKRIQSFVPYGTLNLNHANHLPVFSSANKSLNNYIINLHQSFQQIQQQYKKTTHQSIQKAYKQNLQYLADDNFHEALSLYQQYNQPNMPHVENSDYKNLYALLKHLKENNQLLVRKVIAENKDLLSVTVLLKDNKRYYNLINYTSPAGRTSDANYHLYNAILEELSEQPMYFDFEGSDLPGVQMFYEKFGGCNQPYYQWHFNVLPFPLRWFKR